MGSGGRRASGELVRAYGPAHEDIEGDVIAQCARSRALLHQLSQLAPSMCSVLFCGETGTGKTKLTQLLHAQSAQAARSLRVVNCAALSDALLSDVVRELDEARQAGLAPGTVFLDEVGELSPWGQAVLLSRIEREPGATRFVAATHRDLDAMSASGAFSRELLSRLSAARVALSPLRVRRDEIVPLALHFLRIGLRTHQLRFISVEPELFQLAERYDWPGNVRELKNAMLNALAVNDSGSLSVADLPDAVRSGPQLAMRSYSR